MSTDGDLYFQRTRNDYYWLLCICIVPLVIAFIFCWVFGVLVALS